MIKLESLKKSSDFENVLKHRVANLEVFSIYRKKKFTKKIKDQKKLYISFVMKKKIGNAVKRNRIKRKLRSIVQKMLKVSDIIDLNYTYVILGKEKAYQENLNSLFEKMKQSFKRMDEIKL